MDKRLENKRGITLVVLIVTIIILLILAGVTIAIIRRRKWINFKNKIGKRKICNK